MYTIRQGSRICVDAPAKINLFLELRERRSDGYHELETLMVPISLYDRLYLEASDDHHIHLSTTWVSGSDFRDIELPQREDNLVWKALELLRTRAGTERGIRAHLIKRIPSQAGLGGASSDAAAALIAGNQLWDLGWSHGQIHELAAELGSDVPFFLRPRLARCTGRGELISPLETKCSFPVVIVKPEVGLATANVYQHATVPNRPKESLPLVSALSEGRYHLLAGSLFNRLQQAATGLASNIAEIARFFTETEVCGHQMSGSGTSYFAVPRNRRQAANIAAQARAAGLGSVFSATTIRPQPVL